MWGYWILERVCKMTCPVATGVSACRVRVHRLSRQGRLLLRRLHTRMILGE